MGELQQGAQQALKDAGLDPGAAKAIAQSLAGLTATGVGAAVGGTQGAAMAAAVDFNNRQLHPDEEKMIRDNAERFARRIYGTEEPTSAQLEAAMVMLANTAQNLVDNNVGYHVPYFAEAEAFLHQIQIEYAQTTPDLSIPGSDGQKLFYASIEEMNSPWINGAAAELTKAGIIVKTPIPVLTNEAIIAENRDRLTGLPLDDQGRYTQIVTVNGTTYAPKYYSCAVPQCLGQNLDISDPETQEYIKAMDKKLFDDIGKAATVASLVSPVGAVGGTAGVVGAGSSLISGILNDEGMQTAIDESGQIGAQRYLETVWKIPAAFAVRIMAVVNLAGGWDAFVERTQQELSDEKK